MHRSPVPLAVLDTPSPAHPSPGPRQSTGELAAAVYAQLRAIAQNQMNAERAGHTLSATALVHEAFIRLGRGGVPAGQGGDGTNPPSLGSPPSRAAFVHAAAEAMRRILIEHARARGRVKRGGGAAKVSLESIGDVADLARAESEDGGEGIVAFDEAFRRLEDHDGRIAQVVRLRFYAGLTVQETAEALAVSERTVNNDWAYARAWLAREIRRGLEA